MNIFMYLIFLAGICISMHGLKFHAHLKILSDSITGGLIKFPQIRTLNIATYGCIPLLKTLHGDGYAPKLQWVQFYPKLFFKIAHSIFKLF